MCGLSAAGFASADSSVPTVACGDDAAPLAPSQTSASMPAAPLPRPTFPGLEIIEEVAPGVGGMGVVYKARELSLDRVVAVKVTRAHLRTPVGRDFFVSEARAVAKLDHPNILRIHRFNPEHTPPFYVMQFVEGRSLDQAARGRSPAIVAELLEKTARALAYAHSKGIIHRDIKPSNILVDFDNEPHIADFGLAGRLEEIAQGPSTDSPMPSGTPAFIAPEVYQGYGANAPAVDVYALGVTMYVLLTGRQPFTGRSLDQIREAVLHSEPPLPQEISPDVPQPLQRICLKAMEKDPAARYESADVLADDLRRFREGREVSARPTRYQSELRGKLQNHLTDIQLWQEQNLVDLAEMDRLSRPYRSMLASAYPWSVLSRRFPWEAAVLRIGGWLVLISCVLWLAWYWRYLTRAQSVLAIGLPTFAMAVVGWLLYIRNARINALIYLSTGALLVPLFVSVVLAEYDIASYPQASSREFFEDLTRTSDGRPPDGDEEDRFGRTIHHHYFPTNAQITIGALVFSAYCLVLLVATDASILVVWVVIGVYLLCSGLMLRAGLKEWLVCEPRHIARALLFYLGISLLFWPLAMLLNRRARTQPWAPFAYAFAPLFSAAFFTLLAYYGSVEWLDVDEPVLEKHAPNIWLMFDGVVYFAAAIYSRNARSSFIRFWGTLLLLLVPVHLIAPPFRMFESGLKLMPIGQRPATAYELAMLLIVLTIIILGTRLRYLLLTLSGLVGLTLFIFKATQRHFEDYLAWPLILVLIGALAMAAALTSLLLRARRQNEPII